MGGGVIEAVVFDMDGVLIDSEPVWERVRRRFVADHGGRWADDTQDRLMGMSTAEWSAYLASDLGITGLTPQQVAEQVISRHGGRVLAAPAAAAGRDRRGSRAGGAVAAGGGELVAAIADRDGARDGRPRIRVRGDRLERGGPAGEARPGRLPGGGRAARRPRRRRAPAVEDSSNGLRAAVAAGLTVIAIPRPEYPPAADALAAARLVLASLTVLTPDTIDALS